MARLIDREASRAAAEPAAKGFTGDVGRMAVDERKWMSATEFNEVFALCQFPLFLSPVLLRPVYDRLRSRLVR